MSDYEPKIVKRVKRDLKVDRASRNNSGKPRPTLVPVEWIEELMAVMEVGAKRYGETNWKKGMPFNECIDSLERHLIQFKKRIDTDPDDGLSTITKVAVNALFLRYYQMKGLGDDNR